MRQEHIVHIGTLDDVARNLSSLGDSLSILASKMQANLERIERNLVLHNLVVRTGIEVDRLTKWLQEPTEMLAWCTRNLFELDLILRFVLQSEENLKNWMGQAASDEILILDGILELTESRDDALAHIIDKRVRELREMASRHKMKITNPIQISELASRCGLRSQYKAFFKFYSKYVHPSSWITNAYPERVQSWDYKNLFIIQAQLYAGDICQRVSEELGLNKDGNGRSQD